MSYTTKKRTLICLMGFICVITFGFWLHGYFYMNTDDAYVNANILQISSRVPGRVAHIYIADNQYVKAGQVLFQLDPASYEVAVDTAKAKLAMSEAQAALANTTATRMSALLVKKVVSQQEGDSTQANLKSALAQVALDQANLRQAELNLSYTRVLAPESGWITHFSLCEGTDVAASQSLFALISNQEFWIDANFKETEIAHLRQGQIANIKVDMYPQHVFQGVVESISGGSGNVFSLLPPENATGNWVKVTQRVPVRIRVIHPDAAYPLRIGTSASVTVRRA